MSGERPARGALALVLLFAAPSPAPGQGEALGDAYLRVSTSVAVIRAPGARR